MAIGTDDLDFIDEEVIESPLNEELQPNEEPLQEEKDFVDSLLEQRGIEDKSKIKFETDEGEIKEVDWADLNNEDRVNILNQSLIDPETDLDDSEIQLINAIRNSGMTPEEYIKQVETEGVNRYVQNAYLQLYHYSVDQYTDDELFVADFMSRTTDATEEEALEALDKAKSNENLYKKLIGAIREEYKTVEQENIKQAQLEQEQNAQAQYNQFAQLVENLINQLTELSGYDLNLEQDDMQMLYDFITGYDQAGVNHFAKVLADPKTLVEAAWFTLNGRQMIEDITAYYLKEITQVRKESYKKGLADAKADKPSVVYKNKESKKLNDIYGDLDDF